MPMLGVGGEMRRGAQRPSRHREARSERLRDRCMTPSPDAHQALMRRFIRRTIFYLLFLGVVLFGSAGTLRWPGAWIYLWLTAAMSFGGGDWLARHHPGLPGERLGTLIQGGQHGWDKLFMVPMLAIWLGWLVLMGLDAGRYHWSSVPLYAQALGFLLLCLAFYLVRLTLRANSFAAPVIKIQKERGHKVVS